MKPRILDLGAGSVRREGRVHADLRVEAHPDIVLDASYLPFAAGSIDRIECFDLVEHVADFAGLMSELHRVLRPGGRVFITTPHFSCANSYTDPTHVHHFGYRALDYFEPSRNCHYVDARFEIKHRVIRFHGGVVDSIIRRIAARWPDLYEHRIAWIFPAWYLEFELEAVK